MPQLSADDSGSQEATLTAPAENLDEDTSPHVSGSMKITRRVTLYWRTAKIMTKEQYLNQICAQCPASDSIWNVSMEVRRAWDEQYYSKDEFLTHYGSLTFWREAELRQGWQ